MTAEPSPISTLALWSLLARGGQAAQKDLRPAIARPERDRLVKAGLLQTARGPRGAVLLEMTDRGWAWCAEHTDAPLPARSTAGVEVLAALLPKLGAYLKASGTSLAELMQPVSHDAPPEMANDTPARIRTAYLAATGSVLNRAVGLAQLRSALPDVPRPAFDAALRDLAQDGASLLPGEDPARLTRDDHAAALDAGGEARHLLWLTR